LGRIVQALQFGCYDARIEECSDRYHLTFTLIKVLLRISQVFRRLPLPALGASGLILLLAFLFFIFQGTDRTPILETPQVVSSDGLWEIYFSRPDRPESKTLRGGPDAQLADALDTAAFSIDVAMYHLDLWSVRDALIYAHRRGVEVRLITDSAYKDEMEIQALLEAGVSVIEDRRPSLMHHKFIVIDRVEVWTGSMNLTVNGAYRNDNNLFRIRSKEIAENYTREFEEMYVEDLFGVASNQDTPYPVVELNGRPVETYFSPDDYVLIRLLDLLGGAEKSVEFLAYSFTSDSLGEALLELHRRGVVVRGVVEESQVSATGSETPRLRQAGLDFQLDNNPASMHHKVMILDGEWVVLGSYNFTRSAEEKNDENLLILHDPELASQFLLEFERIYQSATQ
jgi:phosphatidylserine/phosphatidylglycerophosphate/cardiolipin synthase-like enzyme